MLLHPHHPARRPRLRRQRRPAAAHPGAGREQRRRDPAAAPHRARPGPRARRHLSALGGVLLGVAAVRVGLWWWVRTHPETSSRPCRFDIPLVLAVAILVPCAVLSALVAALLPSLRLGRLDIIGVMRGQSVSPRLNQVVPGRRPGPGRGRGRCGAVRRAAAWRRGLPGRVRRRGARPRHAAPRPRDPGGLRPARGQACPVAPRMATRDAARHRSRATPDRRGDPRRCRRADRLQHRPGQRHRAADRRPTSPSSSSRARASIYTGDAETRLSVDRGPQDAWTSSRPPLFVARPEEDPMMDAGTSAPATPGTFVSAVPERLHGDRRPSRAATATPSSGPAGQPGLRPVGRSACCRQPRSPDEWASPTPRRQPSRRARMRGRPQGPGDQAVG